MGSTLWRDTHGVIVGLQVVGAPVYVCNNDYHVSWGKLRSYISNYIGGQTIELKLAISTWSSLFLNKRTILMPHNASTGPPRQPWVPSSEVKYRLIVAYAHHLPQEIVQQLVSFSLCTWNMYPYAVAYLLHQLVVREVQNPTKGLYTWEGHSNIHGRGWGKLETYTRRWDIPWSW